MEDRSERNRVRLVLWYDLLIAVLVLMAWASMAFRGGEVALSALGLANLKYFTVLSNLLEGAASLCLAIQCAGVLRGRRSEISRGVYLLKFIAAAAVSVTFLVVMLLFGPMFGYGLMLQGANFWFHLTVPLMAVGEFMLLDRFGNLSLRQTLWAALPPLVYGLVYCLNLLVNGVGEWPDTNDIYGFLTWGLPVGLCIFAAILLLGWGAGCLLRLGNRAGRRVGQQQ